MSRTTKRSVDLNQVAQYVVEQRRWVEIKELVVHFGIERSNNSFSFEKIGFVKSKGQNANYEYVDDNSDSVKPLTVNLPRFILIDISQKEAILI